jgi:hypothetical protein
MIASITASEQERAEGTFSNETTEWAARRFRADGALLLQDVIDPSLIAAARTALYAKYAGYFDGHKGNDTLEVGGRRQMITIDLEPPFDDPLLFANPWLLPVLAGALDDGFVVGAFGAVCSAADAPTQHRHRDGGVLFPQSGIDAMLPATAVTVAIPLLEMNELHGTTTLWLGSHRDAHRVIDENAVEPVVPEGSLVLWDFRLKHSGTPNRSTEVRPLLYLTYCRPWWIDHLNFKKTKTLTPIRAREQSLASLTEEHRLLMARAEAF